ncbi:hypothetical protein Daus18300_006599 [Diaporthe australafricana]|uniref:Cytochrome P450 n=1 Tax=Diaporthe australafricana TaxID=127596 RepID=A0ABR3WT91_9PEZI
MEQQLQTLFSWVSPGSLGLLAVLTLSSVILYRLYLHPLRHIPGPLWGRASSLFLYAISYLGIEARVLRHYHQLYNTKVLRIAPNSVSVSDSAALAAIYVSGGGFQKDARYANFNLGDTKTIFSALDTEYRDVRAKAVAPLFSPGRLRAASEPGGVIHQCISDFVKQLESFRAAPVHESSQQSSSSSGGGPLRIDILDLCARLSLDVVTGYLLGEWYGGLTEHQHLTTKARRAAKLSINPFIFAIVGFSRFSLLPGWVFRALYGLYARAAFGESIKTCMARLDAFSQRLVGQAVDSKEAHAIPATTARDRNRDSYQARLLAAGVTPEEAVVQCEAIVFAGADSTSLKLATVLFHLVQNPARLERLRRELSREEDGEAGDPAAPYLRAVVKEGLRLGMANPTRQTRVVPERKEVGLRVGGVHVVPPGAVVGAAAYVLHHDPAVFPRPFEFRPERWLEPGMDEGLRRPDMERSLLMFGLGLRACIGKNLAQQQLHEAVKAVALSGVLEGARTVKERIELVEWFNAEIKGHVLEIEWP